MSGPTHSSAGGVSGEAPFAPRPAGQSGAGPRYDPPRRGAAGMSGPEDSSGGIEVTISGSRTPFLPAPPTASQPSPGAPRTRGTASYGGAARHRAPGSTVRTSLLGVGAAVSVLAVAIIISSANSGDAARSKTPTPPRTSAAAPPAVPADETPSGRPVRYRGPIPTGWYQIRPVIDPDVRRCLVVDPTQRVTSSLVQSSCTGNATYTHRLKLVRNGVYQIKPRSTNANRSLCVTVGTVNGARLYLTPCDPNASNQRFTLRAAGRTREYGTLYQVRPYHTRVQNMCVDIDANKGSRLADGAEAAQQLCSRARSQRMAFLTTT